MKARFIWGVKTEAETLATYDIKADAEAHVANWGGILVRVKVFS